MVVCAGSALRRETRILHAPTFRADLMGLVAVLAVVRVRVQKLSQVVLGVSQIIDNLALGQALRELSDTTCYRLVDFGLTVPLLAPIARRVPSVLRVPSERAECCRQSEADD